MPLVFMYRWKRWRRACLCLAALFIVSSIGLFLIDRSVSRAASPRIHDAVDNVPERTVALVLGTSKYVAKNRINVYYRERIRTAAELFHAGKVRGLLVSGDNSRHSYNEPEYMRQDLIAAGVPDECITLDYAGFRTLDSIVRAREVFGLDEFVVVTQRFHAERAVYIANAHGIDAVGCVATDAIGIFRVRVRLREVLARAKAFLDVHILGTGPKFLGPRETVSLR